MQLKQHMLLHKWEKESGELGEWYKAQCLIKIKCERKGPRSGAEPFIHYSDGVGLSLAEVKEFLCLVGLPRSCHFFISSQVNYILSMAHCVMRFGKAQTLRGQT